LTLGWSNNLFKHLPLWAQCRLQKIDKSKHKGRSEKLQAKKRQALQADAAKCGRITDVCCNSRTFFSTRDGGACCGRCSDEERERDEGESGV